MALAVSSVRGPVLVSVCIATHAHPEVVFQPVKRAEISPDEICSPAKIWIENAEALVRSGFLPAAGGMARIALERLLSAAVIGTGGKPRGMWKVRAMIRSLLERGAIDEPLRDRLRTWNKVGSCCAHGGRASIEQILDLVAGVRFLECALPR